MLTIHAGMPKTGTTAFQRALANSAAALEEIDVLYPVEFRNGEGLAHHALSAEMASQNSLSGGQAGQFLEFLDSARTKRVVISSEAFTNCLSRRKILTFLHFLSACSERMPLRLVFALRRVDTFFESMYLHSVKVGETAQSIESYLEARFGWADEFFAQLSVLRNIGLVERVALVRYERNASFVRNLLIALNIRPVELGKVEPVVSRNERLGLKAQSLLLHLPYFEKLLGENLHRERIVQAFEKKQFSFAGDTDVYSVIDRLQRLYHHEKALRAAMDCGIMEYGHFFANQQPEARPFFSLSPDLLISSDLESLATFIRRAPALQSDRVQASAVKSA